MFVIFPLDMQAGVPRQFLVLDLDVKTIPILLALRLASWSIQASKICAPKKCVDATVQIGASDFFFRLMIWLLDGSEVTLKASIIIKFQMKVIVCKFFRNYIKGNAILKYVSISKSLNSCSESFHMSSNVDDLSSGKKSFKHVDDTSVVVAMIRLLLNQP